MTKQKPAFKSSLLLVDTSHETNRQLHAALGGVFEFVYTTSGSDDVADIVKVAQPRLVIIELYSVKKNGFQVCRDLSFNDALRELPCVVIIEPSDVDHMSTGFYMGATDYMVKPLVPAEVLARVGGQLELASSSQVLKDLDASVGNIKPRGFAKTRETMNTKILVVDDCVDSLEPLTNILSQAYTVHTASNGREAIALAQMHKFDLVLLDVVMPEMSGYEVCKKLKASNETSDTPVIFLTGQAEPKQEAFGIDIGAIDYIQKPVSLTVVLSRIKSHLKNLAQQKQLAQLTFEDTLTQIPNRRRFNTVYEQEVKRAQRNKTPLSLLLIDVDQFKIYNDHFGHLAGDECLKAIGAALVRCQRRPGDIVCRFGGEEFVALLPDTDLAGAIHVANIMLQTVKGLEIEHAAHAEHKFVSISVGAACANAGEAIDAKNLIAVADKRLYLAKTHGRDQVCTESTEMLAACS